MNFDRPGMLLLLWILPLVAGLMIYAQRKRAAAARRFVQSSMLARLMPPIMGTRPWIKGTLVLLGLAAIIVACARPRFGVYFEKVVQRGVDCFICLDVSRSMLAEDVAPSRLGRAKSDIRDLLKKLAGDHVGLIVFAGKPVVKVPLTTDDGFFRTVLDEVDTHSAPRGGTLIGDAIRKAMEAMPPRADHDQIIVLITDGEDQESYAAEAAKQAAEKGIKIFTVGLGDSTEGARIPVRVESGGLTYEKDEKGEHWSKTDQDLLKQIALATGGAHIPAGTKAYDLGQIYEDHLANLARGEEENQKRKRFQERYQIFLGLGLALLALERMIPIYGRPNGRGRKS
jgi:Ca-activated chloride channel homolog